MKKTNSKPYLERMYEEQKRLKERIDKVTGFLLSDKAKEIAAATPGKDRSIGLLRLQMDAMRLYEHILSERIRIEEEE